MRLIQCTETVRASQALGQKKKKNKEKNRDSYPKILRFSWQEEISA